MKSSIKLSLLSIIIMFSCNENSKTFNNKLDMNVKTLLSKLTLEDKVGEMTQLALDVLSVGEPYNIPDPHTFDADKLQKVLVDLKVGSILNVNSHAFTRKEWKKIISTIQEYATERKSSGIPVLYGIDAIHGTTYTMGSTLFPQQLGQASTWNRQLANDCGQVTAYETKASGIPWIFAPVMDLGIDARWPRLWETYGEDVYLSSEMGTQFVKGIQGDDISAPNNAVACLKHFLGYSAPKRGKDRMAAWISDRYIREYFLPGFKQCIENGAKTIMINSGEINGIPTHADKRLLTDILRGELGFTGVTVSDWEDVGYLKDRHRIAATYKEAIMIAVNAGMDMAMVPMNTEYPTLLKELVEEGKVSMQRIDEAVSRILRLKIELGLFDSPVPNFESYTKFASDEHKNLAQNAADESIILLKNEEALPLKKSSKILVVGPTANQMQSLNGGWTGTWQGNNPKYDTPYAKTVLEELQNEFGISNVINGGNKITTSNASRSDAIVLCLGENSYTEKPGDIDDLTLPQEQIDLVKKAKSTGKKIIVILLEGRPRIINKIVDDAGAIVLGLFPGNHGSKSIANILSGDLNPSGKLPITYPQYVNDLVTYDHKGTDLAYRDYSMNGFNPQFEFAHGLSYSNFVYSNLTVSQDTFNMSDKIEVTVDITNNSKIDGKESVQLFVSDKVASITPSVKRLRGFDKINLKAGKKQTVRFTLDSGDLSFVGIDNEWVTESGEFGVTVGGLKDVFFIK